jgi:hypothetical protein
LENVQRFLLGRRTSDSSALWSRICYYNFIQRPMKYGRYKERPEPIDWRDGWRVFRQVVEVLKPRHCIFIGVTASHHFSHVTSGPNDEASDVLKLTKVRRTWARAAHLRAHETEIGITFMRHCGAHFSWMDWHQVLLKQCGPALSALMAAA